MKMPVLADDHGGVVRMYEDASGGRLARSGINRESDQAVAIRRGQAQLRAGAAAEVGTGANPDVHRAEGAVIRGPLRRGTVLSVATSQLPPDWKSLCLSAQRLMVGSPSMHRVRCDSSRHPAL